MVRSCDDRIAWLERIRNAIENILQEAPESREQE
jgi:hypothetical protein